LDWAFAKAQGSINQPNRPWAILILNRCGSDTASELWDESRSTEDLLNFSITGSSAFNKYMKMTGEISMDKILGKFYANVTVLRLPDKNNYQLLDTQRGRLYKVIRKACDYSHQLKKQRRMLPDADDLQLYLQLAFDHFSERLDEPFDFIAASLRHRPMPKTLKEHILNLAQRVARDTGNEKTESVFGRLTKFIASCIRLDAARKNLLGIYGLMSHCYL
jgi:hypothetical protein